MSPAVPDREPSLTEDWELVVGLEVHVELSTATKLFCGCANRFGDEPNTNVCPVCLGLPGSLPVPNATAVSFAMRLGRALGCEVRGAVFARKNYFYPDMPKDYQISQYDQPTNTDGRLDLPDGHVVGIERAHIEEDTGKTTHIGGGGRIHDADHALVDYNRAGVPLVEIVSRPDIRTAEQARSYVRELRAILLAIGVSDARMEEGSMRGDANVSVRPTGSDELRTRCEIKNLSSLRALGRAIVYEAQRHVDLWSGGERPRQETRHWDEANGRTTPGRSKEDADDYRYFQDPDLVPLAPPAEAIAAIDAALPPLPAARRAELVEVGGGAVSAEDAALLVERGQDGLVRSAVAAGADPALTATRVANELAVEDWAKVTPGALAALVAMEILGQVTATQAKQVLAEMAESGDAPEAIARRRGFEAMASDDLAAVLEGVIDGNPDAWARYCAGDDAERKKLAGFLTGQVMRATKGRADGAAVNRLLQERARI
ncbi:MAG: Asp-tRNA(Asn)/Glu-tRNA(Gln) amidotransferase subunit GatB [Acidimicrobiaceae bacterium]|nr:Asp-tRNA(Asn)/Glu-tRNA(Gln) amidotransferase subunit GatB [Acidimicrobiaceae bacterium]